jgi:hypothetical protein
MYIKLKSFFMKKINFLFAITLAFLISFVSVSNISAIADYEIFSSNTGADAEDHEPIEVSFTNNTGVPVTIGQIDVQRLGYEDWETDIDDWPTIEVEGWSRTTLETDSEDTFPNTTVNPGETATIATIALGSPASWRGWYGGGDIVLKAWINITPMGGVLTEWESNLIHHQVIPATCEPGIPHGGFSTVEFVQDNKDGSATIAVVAIDCEGEPVTGLGKTDFGVYQLLNDQATDARGTIASVVEAEPGIYTLVWRYIVGTHVIILTAMEMEIVTDLATAISTEAIPRTFKSVVSNLADILNVENTEKDLAFTMPGFGSISFAPGLNLINYMEELAKLADLLVITYDAETNVMRASVDTKALTFLAGHNATITFFGVSEKMGIEGLTAANFREYLDIAVYDEGEIVGKISDYFDWDDVTYDPETDTLTLPVNHFTEYVLGEAVAEEVETLTETGSAIVLSVTIALLSLTTYAILKKYKLFVN